MVDLHGSQLVVVTDLDATLLDEATYSHAPAIPALEALRSRRIPLVIATSKTRAEVDALTQLCAFGPAIIVENGGAVVIPANQIGQPGPDLRRESERYVLDLGLGRPLLLAHLAEIAAETGASIRGFADMDLDEVSRVTGLPHAAARLACDRHYDEPFLLDDATRLPAIMDAAQQRRLRVTTGGRFHHLTGQIDKGTALAALLAILGREGRRFTTVGLGDAGNDLSFLRIVDRPVIVPRPGNRPDPALAAALPWAEQAPLPGPAGWNAAVLAVLAGDRLPAVRREAS